MLHWTVGVYSTCYVNNITKPDCFDLIEKLYSNYARIISQAMGFTFELVFANTGGTLNPNGTWTGLFGLVNRSEVDVAISPLIVNEQRNEAASFSFPYHNDDLLFITRKHGYSKEALSILHPFSPQVWLATALFVVFLTLMYYIIFRKRIRYQRIATEVLAVCLNQSPIVRPRRTSQKILVGAWMVGFSVMTAAYLSGLLSFLTLPDLEGITDIPELAKAVKRRQWKCIIIKGSAVPFMLLDSPSQYVKIVGESIISDPNSFLPLELILQNIRERVAYIGTKDVVRVVKEMFFISKDSFIRTMYAFPTSKAFVHKQKLDLCIHRVVASGIFDKLHSDISFENAFPLIPSEDSEGSFPRQLNLGDVRSAFLCLLYGYAAACVVLVFEKLYHRNVSVGTSDLISNESSRNVDLSS